MKRSRFQALFNDCPGAVLGSGPEMSNPGRIIVESEDSVRAIEYMRTKTKMLRIEPHTRWCEGIVIVFDWKEN